MGCAAGCAIPQVGMHCGMHGDAAWNALWGMRGGAAWNALRMATVAHGLPCLQEDVSRAFSKTVRSVDCFT